MESIAGQDLNDSRRSPGASQIDLVDDRMVAAYSYLSRIETPRRVRNVVEICGAAGDLFCAVDSIHRLPFRRLGHGPQ